MLNKAFSIADKQLRVNGIVTHVYFFEISAKLEIKQRLKEPRAEGFCLIILNKALYWWIAHAS
tara:strand:- start:2758 stop:2946 length:189 start_codon:yes stop_codon:yes gene_type:complete